MSRANSDVSVVMSVYNAGPQLLPTVESVLSQTGVDFELIIIDDGSTDGSGELLDQIADSRVHVIHQVNRGLTKALIAGCDAARGRYIARQDAGDLSRPHRLARQKAALDAEPSLAFVSCWTDYIGPAGEPLYTASGTGVAVTPQYVLDAGREWLMSDGPANHASTMFRADAYRKAGGYRAAFYFGQDWDLWYRLAAVGRFQMIPESLYLARVEPGSISTTARREQQKLARLSRAAARARMAGRSDSQSVELAAKIGRGKQAICAEARGNYFIGQLLRRNGDARARGYFTRAVRSCPLHLKAWIRLLQTFTS